MARMMAGIGRRAEKILFLDGGTMQTFISLFAYLYLRKVKKINLRKVLLLSAISLVVALSVYVASSWLFQLFAHAVSQRWGGSWLEYMIPSSEISFLDGILLIIAGVAFLLGSGGISLNSRSAAMLAATANAMGSDTIGPGEIMRRDAWRPKGNLRLGSVLVVAGIFLFALSFLL